MILTRKEMRHVIGYIGEKCALQYLRALGFHVKMRRGKFDGLPYYHGDLELRKYLYPKLVSIKPKKAYDLMTGEWRDDVDVEREYDGPFFEYRNVEVKASFGRFPRLSNTLSSQQKKTLNDLLFLLVKIKEVSPKEIIYEVREVPPDWTSSESIEPWKGEMPRYPTQEQMQDYVDRLKKKIMTEAWTPL